MPVNLHTHHQGDTLDELTHIVKAAEQRSCEGYDWHFDAQGQEAIACGFEAIVVITSCCGELCQRCLDKPADHVHEVIERFEEAIHG